MFGAQYVYDRFGVECEGCHGLREITMLSQCTSLLGVSTILNYINIRRRPYSDELRDLREV